MIVSMISLLFGSTRKILIFFVITSIVASASFAFIKYKKTLNEVEILNNKLDFQKKELATLNVNALVLQTEIEDLKTDLKKELQRREEIEKGYRTLTTAYDAKTKIFNEEIGRFRKLFVKKSKLIIARANKKTKETFIELERIANDEVIIDLN